MAETQIPVPVYGTPGAFEVVRAEALFVSNLQPSGSPSPSQVSRAVTTTLRRLGVSGCTARMAGEFGDHPDTAATRMCWALTTIRTVYPSLPGTGVTRLRPLVFLRPPAFAG